MLKKRRSRRLWGISRLSALYLSCGVMFVMGNVYILHSGFSQAYSNLDLEDREPFLQQQPDEYGTQDLEGWGGRKREDGMLKDLPAVALAAFGYQKHLHLPLFQVGELRHSQSHQPISPVLQGGSDTRLRKLMENHREGWQSDGPHLPNTITGSNTGRKQRTKAGKSASVEDTQNQLSSPHHVPLQGLSRDFSHTGQSSVLHYKQHSDALSYVESPMMDKMLVDRLHDEYNNKKSMRLNEINQVLSRTDVVDIPVTDLRQLLGHGSQCGLVRTLTGREYISSGWTKTVHRAHLPGLGGPAVVAVKTVDITGHDVSSCIKESLSPNYCYNRASQKLMKEIVLLRSFNNTHIIEVSQFPPFYKKRDKYF